MVTKFARALCLIVTALAVCGATTWTTILTAGAATPSAQPKTPTAHRAAPQPTPSFKPATAAHFPARTFARDGVRKGAPRAQSKTGPSQAAAPNVLGSGSCAQYGSDAAVNSNFYEPDPTSGNWAGEVNTDCVLGFVPATFLLTATLTDYSGNQVGSTQQTNLSGVTAPFDWKLNFGPTNLPTSNGSYTYTAHYYRQTDIPPNDTGAFTTPDTRCAT